MSRSSLTALLALVLAAACTQTSQTPTPTSPIVNIPAPGASGAPSASAPVVVATASPDDAGAEQPGAVGDTGSVDGGAPAQYRACSKDADCVFVERVGCCHNGWGEAVAASQKDAYSKSFTCPNPHPVCPMFLIRDLRVPQCDNAAHLCTMVQPEHIACEGHSLNPHRCPDGYVCQANRVPDAPGKCVKK